jgi:hypothetical protein
VTDVAEKIFAAAFESLQGKPASTEAFREIARGAVRCALMWVDGLMQFAGPVEDSALVDIVRVLAEEELAAMRRDGDRLNFSIPRDPQH